MAKREPLCARPQLSRWQARERKSTQPWSKPYRWRLRPSALRARKEIDHCLLISIDPSRRLFEAINVMSPKPISPREFHLEHLQPAPQPA
jgi:hypothetical protein